MSNDHIVFVFVRRSNHVAHNYNMCDTTSQALYIFSSSHCERFQLMRALTICLLCPICMFHDAKVFVIHVF